MSTSPLRSLRVLLRKEFLQIGRDKVILRMLFIMPLLQLVVLANAATFEVKRGRLWVVDQSHTAIASSLINQFMGSGRFQLVGTSVTAEAGDDALREGGASAVLILPPDFATTIARERRAVVQLSLNAENGSEAGLIQAYANQIISRFAAELSPSGGTIGAIDVRTRGRYNPSLDYRRFMAPGILVQLITLIGTLMTALNIVREKEAGTLDQLNVTPVRRTVFIAAKLIPMWVIGQLEFAMGLVVVWLMFGISVAGSIPLLFLGSSLFLLAALGLGLWISTIADTQQQALFITFSFLMVYLLMSGLFTPVRAMPSWVQKVGQINPMMHFIAMVRSVMLKGAGLADVWRQLVALAFIGATVLTLALTQFRKQAS